MTRNGNHQIKLWEIGVQRNNHKVDATNIEDICIQGASHYIQYGKKIHIFLWSINKKKYIYFMEYYIYLKA